VPPAQVDNRGLRCVIEATPVDQKLEVTVDQQFTLTRHFWRVPKMLSKILKLGRVLVAEETLPQNLLAMLNSLSISSVRRGTQAW
jgi:hypothetical protein